MSVNIKYKTDYELVHRYIKGDEEAGRILYKQIYELSKCYIFSRTKDSSLTFQTKEDILMESMKKSIELMDRYNGESKFSTFVIGIVKNKIREHYRILNNKKEDLIGDEVYNIKQHDTTIKEIIDKEKLELLNKAIDSLSEKHKSIIQLRLFNNVPYKTISIMFEKSVPALESLHRRALKKLKEKLKEFDVF